VPAAKPAKLEAPWKRERPPEPAPAATPCALLVTGVGGTGIVTISAVIGMAAYLEGLHFTSLDMAGLAQKGGEVAAHLRIAASADELTSPRVDAGDADSVIAGDLVMAASARMLEKIRPGATRLVVNDDEIPTGEFTRDADLRFPKAALKTRLATVAGAERCDFIDAAFLANEYLGDAIATNTVLLGFAFQRGLLPLPAAAIERAIAENGTAVEMNLAAFLLGRVAASNPAALAKSVAPASAQALTVDDHAKHLEAYQDERYALDYREFVREVEQLERDRCGSAGPLTSAVARTLSRLMSYKDEYEVARLLTMPSFEDTLRESFGGGASITYHLAPPMLSFLKDGSGRPRKIRFGSWLRGPFRLLHALRGLRGTPFDPFGYGAERKREREAIATYRRRVKELIARMNASNRDAVVAALAYADQIRGYGPVKDQSFVRAEEWFRSHVERFDAPAMAVKDAA
jgi:indolepyruvate ferredoxin oxidoreductase